MISCRMSMAFLVRPVLAKIDLPVRERQLPSVAGRGPILILTMPVVLVR